MKEQKVHTQVNGRAVCGVEAKRRKLVFASDDNPTNCKRCLKATAK